MPFSRSSSPTYLCDLALIQGPLPAPVTQKTVALGALFHSRVHAPRCTENEVLVASPIAADRHSKVAEVLAETILVPVLALALARLSVVQIDLVPEDAHQVTLAEATPEAGAPSPGAILCAPVARVHAPALFHAPALVLALPILLIPDTLAAELVLVPSAEVEAEGVTAVMISETVVRGPGTEE